VGSTGAATTLALAAGVAGSLQIAILGILGQRIGELEAAAFAFALTAVAGVVILLVARRSLAGFGDALAAPAWMWIGGLMGVLIVTAIVITGPRIGIVATSALLIAGQLASATIIDRFGWFGIEKVPIGWWRLAGLVLLGIGALLTLRR
jgi:transporter family-2 protein